MSDYTQITDFSAKDSLASGDPLKIIKGSDVDAELAAIATAIATKGDNSGLVHTTGDETIAGNKTISGNTILSGTATMTGKSLWTAEGAAVASAGTTDIWTTDGNTIHVTGTTTITSFGTAPQAGAVKWVIFDGALTLTHGANLVLPGAANITTAAGDVARVYADSTTQFDVQYFPLTGRSVIASPGWQPIETQSPSAAGTVTLATTLAAGTRYRLWFNLTKNTAGHVMMRFNADTGSNYGWGGITTTASAGPTRAGSTSDTSIQLDGNNPGDTNSISGTVEFVNPNAAGSDEMTVDVQTIWCASEALTSDMWKGFGKYNGSAAVTGVSIINSAGTVTGTVVLEKYVAS